MAVIGCSSYKPDKQLKPTSNYQSNWMDPAFDVKPNTNTTTCSLSDVKLQSACFEKIGENNNNSASIYVYLDGIKYLSTYEVSVQLRVDNIIPQKYKYDNGVKYDYAIYFVNIRCQTLQYEITQFWTYKNSSKFTKKVFTNRKQATIKFPSIMSSAYAYMCPA